MVGKDLLDYLEQKPRYVQYAAHLGLIFIPSILVSIPITHHWKSSVQDFENKLSDNCAEFEQAIEKKYEHDPEQTLNQAFSLSKLEALDITSNDEGLTLHFNIPADTVDVSIPERNLWTATTPAYCEVSLKYVQK